MKKTYHIISIETFLSLIIILIIDLFAAIEFIGKMNSTLHYPNGIDWFQFWTSILHGNIGSIVMFLSPILVAILATTTINKEFTGSILKNKLLRVSYKKAINRSLASAYVKSYFPFFINYILILIIGIIIYTPAIIKENYCEAFYINYGIESPITLIIISFILLLLYTSSLANISLITMRYIKKYILNIFASFAIMFFSNYIVANGSMVLAKIIGNETFIKHAYSINFYNGYIIMDTIHIALIQMLILFIITFSVTKILYSNKEKVVRHFE